MGRKNRAKKQPTAPPPEFEVNPFAGLGELLPKESLPKPEETKPAPPREPPAAAGLAPEDRELLQAFGGDSADSLAFRTGTGKAPQGPLVSLAIQRKGKGGKTVTHVRGLAELPLAERMELSRDIGRNLGTNARFLDDLLELQGDQRDRATAWLAERGFRTRRG